MLAPRACCTTRAQSTLDGLFFSFLFPVDVMLLLLLVDGGCGALQARKTPQTDTDTTDGSLAADTWAVLPPA